MAEDNKLPTPARGLDDYTPLTLEEAFNDETGGDPEIERVTRNTQRHCFLRGAEAVLERLAAGDSPAIIRAELHRLEFPPRSRRRRQRQ
jgi:hypothetical protein